MKRTDALVILISLAVICAIAFGVFISMLPGDDRLGTYMEAAGDTYASLLSGSGDNGSFAFASGDSEALPTQDVSTTHIPVEPSTAAQTSQPTQDATDAVVQTTTALTSTDAPKVTATAKTTASPTAVPTVSLPQAQNVTSLSDAESFGTPEKLSEDQPKSSLSALASETGLDEEVLEKLYTPFYVLDIDMDEVYYPLKSPGGSHISDKIYGGQVGVEVVSIDGDYAYIKAHRYPGGRAIEGYVPTSLLKKVTPSERYSIVIDKRQQRLFLFEYGELVADMYCSTGKTTTETPAGEFIKYGTKHTIYSDADPDIAYYGIRLNGRVYIHSVSHIDGDYSKSISMLGRKASHGCIRVPLDWAKWFYEKIPDGTKVIITEYRGDTPPLGEGGRDGD